MRELICIVCPRGCHLTVDDNLNVTGNSCKRGEAYGKQEVVKPMRTITSTVKIESELVNRIPVKTTNNIPKENIFDLMELLKGVSLKAPVHIGDVVLKGIFGTDVDVVACRNIEK